jgi:hypothetical protein
MKNFRKMKIVLCIFLFASRQASGNDLELSLPAFAGDTVFVTAFSGAKQDTVAVSTLDKEGYARLALPFGSGICFLKIGDRLDFAFIRSDKENAKIKESKDLSRQLEVLASPENDSINAWFVRQSKLRDKMNFWQQGKFVYKDDEPQSGIIADELAALQQAKANFDEILKNSLLYSARYLEIRTFLDERSGALFEYEQKEAACESFRRYLLDSLDMEALYTSDMWVSAINTAMQLYRNLGNFQKQGVFWKYFAEDMQQIYARIREKDVRNRFEADLREICGKNGWKVPSLSA